MIRAVLAATLSSVYGIYSGFEFCENTAASRPRGVSRFGEISVERARLGRAGKYQGLDHALESHPADRIALCSSTTICGFIRRKTTRFFSTARRRAARDNIIFVVVNLDPDQIADIRFVNIPLEDFGLDEGEDISGARSADRRALHLARTPQLRGAQSASGTGRPHLPARAGCRG